MKNIFLLLLFILSHTITGAQINSADTVVFDLSRASCVGSYFLVPVSFKSNDVIYAIDFSMKYNQAKISYNSIQNYYPSAVSASANYSTSDSTLRFTSFSMQPMAHDTQIVAARFNLLLSPVLAGDYNTIHVYLNGDQCSYKIIPPVLPASIGASGPVNITAGDTVTLTATAGAGLNYLWSTNATTQSISVTTAGTYVVTVTTSGGCTSSAAVTVTINSSLPVELVDFFARENNEVIIVDWTTVSEINNDYFTLEKSADGNHWEDLVIVNGAGNSSATINYSVTDKRPFSGLNYYRLRQTDFDGTLAWSDIASVFFSDDSQNISVSIFPSPAKDVLNVVTSSDATVQLMSIDGSRVFAFITVSANQKMKIGTENLANGVYLLKVYNDNYVSTKKVVIQK